MGKWWKSGVLIGTWLGLVLAAHAQYGPVPPQPEPIPYGPSGSGAGPPPAAGGVIVGGLRGRDVPPGPDANLALPGDIPNAFGGENLIDPNAEVEGGFRVMAGVLILKPHLKRKTAFTLATPTTSSQEDFDYDSSVAPWIELEYLSNIGWGVRARYWHFGIESATIHALNQSRENTLTSNGLLPGIQMFSPFTGNIAPLLPSPPGRVIFFPGSAPIPATLLAAGVGADRLSFDSQITMDVVDLEVTRYVIFDAWQFSLATGLRLAALSQNYTAVRDNGPGSFVFQTGPPPNLQNATLQVDRDHTELSYTQSFKGLGPTTVVELRLPFGQTGLAFYANTRFSLLVGQSKEEAGQAFENRGNVVTPRLPQFPLFQPYDITTFRAAATKGGRVVPEGDFEAGAEWDIAAGDFRPLVQAAFVSQNWFAAGSPTGRDGNLDLVGVKIGVGVQY